jgi:hypothetical protein
MRKADKRRKEGLRPPLRRATKQDARTLAELVDYAGHGIPGYLWSRSAKEGQPPI